MTRFYKIVSTIIVCSSSSAMPATAQSYTFDGDCDGQSWWNAGCFPMNWDTDRSPGDQDVGVDVIIPLGFLPRSGVTTKELNSITVEGGLLLTTDMILTAGGTFNDTTFGYLSTTQHVVNSGSPVHITGNSLLAGHAFEGGTTFSIDSGTFTINPDSSPNRFENINLNNLATVHQNTSMNLQGDTVVVNQGFWQMGSANISNDGSFTNSGGTVESIALSAFDVPCHMFDGTFRAVGPSGKLRFFGGGQHGGGEYQLATGGTIELYGGLSIDGPMLASGEGNLKFAGDGVFVSPGGLLTIDITDFIGLWLEKEILCDGEIRNQGFANWSRTALIGKGLFQNQPTGHITINYVGTGSGRPELFMDMINTGTIDQQTNFYVSDAGYLLNGGVYDMTQGWVLGVPFEQEFRNAALVRKNGPTNSSSSGFEVPYNQTTTGGIAVEKGTMTIQRSDFIAGGEWIVADDMELILDGDTINIAPPDGPGSGVVTATGIGTLRIRGASTNVAIADGMELCVDMIGDGTSFGFILDGGRMTGEGDCFNYGNMLWNAGIIELFLSNFSYLEIPSSGTRTLTGGLSNYNRVQAGSIDLFGGGITNFETFDVFSGFIGGIGTVRNVANAEFNKLGNSTYTVATTFRNDGVVKVLDGTLSFTGLLEDIEDGCLLRGRWEVAAGARLLMPGISITKILAPSHIVLEGETAEFPALSDSLIELGNDATIDIFGGTNVFSQFTLNDGRLSIQEGGTLETNGTVTNGSDGVMRQLLTLAINGEQGGFIFPQLNNEGTIQPGGPDASGPFNLTGDLVQGTTGIMAVELGGLLPIDEHDQIAITGTATLQGTLELTTIDGYSPKPGDSFTILTANSTSGTFNTITLDDTLCRFVVDVDYAEDAIVITFFSDVTTDDFSFFDGTFLSGNLSDLIDADDSRLRGRSEFGFLSSQPNVLELRVGFTMSTTPSQLDVIFEGSVNNPDATVRVRLRNWNSGSFNQIGLFMLAAPSIDQRVVIENIDAAGFVRPADRRVEVSIRQSVVATFSLSGFIGNFDQVLVCGSE